MYGSDLIIMRDHIVSRCSVPGGVLPGFKTSAWQQINHVPTPSHVPGNVPAKQTNTLRLVYSDGHELEWAGVFGWRCILLRLWHGTDRRVRGELRCRCKTAGTRLAARSVRFYAWFKVSGEKCTSFHRFNFNTEHLNKLQQPLTLVSLIIWVDFMDKYTAHPFGIYVITRRA